MANTNAAFGFRPLGRVAGGAPNYGLDHYLTQAAQTDAIYRGDPVILSGGYVDIATAGTEAILGVFWGCHYNSIARKQPVWSPYWPGSDALALSLVDMFVITDPQAMFLVQTDGTSAWTQANVGKMSQFVSGTGSTTTGNSGYSLSHTAATTSTLPFRVVGLLSDIAPPGVNGIDNTSAFNQVIVKFNNTIFTTTNAP